MEKNRMKKLLFVNACVRGEASRTLELSRFYIDGFLEEEKVAGRNWDVEEVCLDEIEGLKPLDSSELALRDSLLAAKEFGHSVRREVGYLTIHSMLHLLGYDHLDEGPQKAQMRAREEAIAGQIPGMSRT